MSSAWDRLLQGRGMKPYSYADNRTAWWIPRRLLPGEMVAFRWEGGPEGRRNLLGEFRSLHWHLGVSARPWFMPEPHLRLTPRIVFTPDGQTPLENRDQSHRLRRSVARTELPRLSRWYRLGKEDPDVPTLDPRTDHGRAPP
jgi:hypothetical protein